MLGLITCRVTPDSVTAFVREIFGYRVDNEFVEISVDLVVLLRLKEIGWRKIINLSSTVKLLLLILDFSLGVIIVDCGTGSIATRTFERDTRPQSHHPQITRRNWPNLSRDNGFVKPSPF